MKVRKLHFTLLVCGLFVAILTLYFVTTDLDIRITGLFYNPAGTDTPTRFPVGELEPWHWFYENDRNLVYVMLAISLFFMVFGLVKKRYRPFLVYGSFIIVAYLIGPGLIVNALLKGTDIGELYIGWGRFRPKETVLFGGTEQYFSLWEPAFLYGGTGKSFPSGHPTSGLIFITLFFIFNNEKFISRIFGEPNERKTLIIRLVKYSGLGLSIFLGVMLGIARVVQGAHFASDVLYSFVFTWLPTAVVYYLMYNIPKLERKAMKKMLSGNGQNTSEKRLEPGNKL